MKKINQIYIITALGLSLVSCANEAPFKTESSAGTGKVLTSSLSLEVKSQNPKTRVNEKGIPSQDDFSVKFYNVNDEITAVKSYDSYSSMPSVVELPQGEYKIVASYGGNYGASNLTAGFNAPHYKGESGNFTVKVDEITDNIEPIVCKLQNVRVSVNFDTSIASAMSNDSKVTVQVGEYSATALDFNSSETRDGYFEYAENSNTLIATFKGKVEGIDVTEIRTFNNVEPGNYYQITFKLNYANSAGPGNIEPGGSDIEISATVSYQDLSKEDENDNITPDNDDDYYLEDDMRPENGDNPNMDQDDPSIDNPDSGDNDPSDDPNENDVPGPQITASEGVDLKGVNDALSLSQCVLYIHCDGGIQTFVVDIDSEALVADLINMSGWEDASQLDLVNPGEKEAFLEELLKRKIGQSLIGANDMEFDITNFLSLLESFKGIHKFKVSVSDQNGKSNEATLQLEIK